MRLESVGKRYGLRQPWVVRSVSLDVLPGRLIRLEGRNGSGKSTLLRVAAGVSLPSAGRVTGRPHTGYVPERFPGGLPFSGRDYLLHLARVHGLRGPAAARAVDEWLDRLGAAGYADEPSGAQVSRHPADHPGLAHPVPLADRFKSHSEPPRKA